MSAVVEMPRVAPMPADVDGRAENYHELDEALAAAKKAVQEAGKALADREAELIDLVRSFGGPHATKSKILHGTIWELVATFAQFTSQDTAAVERFRRALVEQKKGRLLKKIFERDVRWTMRAGAAEILRAETEKFSPRLRAELMMLLMLCSSTQDKKPSLDVRKKKKGVAK
jgi:hypothetical protein